MRFMFASLLALAVATPLHARDLGAVVSVSTTIDADLAACRTQGNLPWCRGETPKGKPITVNLLQDASRRVFNGFISKLDTTPDTLWHSAFRDMTSPSGWEGNCDNVVFTALDFMSRNHIDMSNVYRVLVSTKRDGKVDHMVAVARIDGQLWVFADAERREVYPIEQATWAPVWLSSVSSIKWFKAAFI